MGDPVRSRGSGVGWFTLALLGLLVLYAVVPGREDATPDAVADRVAESDDAPAESDDRPTRGASAPPANTTAPAANVAAPPGDAAVDDNDALASPVAASAESPGGPEDSEDVGRVAGARCESVDAPLVSAIGVGLTDRTTRLQAAQAVRSRDHEGVWFVAVELEGAGREGTDDVAVWGTRSLVAGGDIIYAVDELARESSDWLDGDVSDLGLEATDDGVAEARACTAAVLSGAASPSAG